MPIEKCPFVMLPLGCCRDRSQFILVEPMISDQSEEEWTLSKQELFPWPESATGQLGWPGAKSPLPIRLEVSEELPGPQCRGNSPHKSQPPSSTTGLPQRHMLYNIVPPHATVRPGFTSRVLHSCQPRNCLIIIFTVLLLFWEFKSV